MPREMHRWVIDSITGHIAAIEVDGATIVRLPQWVLPRSAVEGQVLLVEHEIDGKGKRSVISIEIDHAATAAALDASRAQVDTMRNTSARRDPGGDIKL